MKFNKSLKDLTEGQMVDTRLPHDQLHTCIKFLQQNDNYFCSTKQQIKTYPE